MIILLLLNTLKNFYMVKVKVLITPSRTLNIMKIIKSASNYKVKNV